MSDQAEIGAVLQDLWRTIEARREASPETSYTAKLLSAGPRRCAKKFGEEAVEAALAAVAGDRDELISESADVLYHWLVLLASSGVTPTEVAAALAAREGVSGHDEKASRPD